MQPNTEILFIVLLLPFLGAAVVPLVYRILGERTAYYAATIAMGCFALLVTQYEVIFAARAESSAITFSWIPALGIELMLYLDGLSLLVGLLATGVGALVFIYSRGYMHGEPDQTKYYATLLAFMGAMLGVTLAADLILLFVFWELTSITSYLLIGHYSRTDSGQYAARKSLLITVIGGLFMLVGFLLLAFLAPGPGRVFALVGTENSLIANASAVREALRSAGLFVPVLFLLVVGAAAKSAQAPLHVWLPNAMEAPTPVSAFLHSATMVKAGVYLLGRFRPLFLPGEAIGEIVGGVHTVPAWTLLVATLGLISMTVTAMLAIGATDIKELLAYSTASHLGLIIAGFGLNSKFGAETGAFHILNHAVFKAALFLVAGIIAHEAGTRDLRKLGGLWRDLPLVAAVTAVTALGMAGIPPFNGFYSKELLFEATWKVAVEGGGLFWLVPALAVFGSVFTFLYSIRFLMLFFGERPADLGHVHSPSRTMVAPALLLAGLAVVISLGGITTLVGLHLGPVEELVGAVVMSVLSAGTEITEFTYHLPTEFTPWAGMSALTLAIGAGMYPFYDKVHASVRQARAFPITSPDWYYDTLTEGLNHLADRVDQVINSGVIRIYAAGVLLSTSVLALGGYAATGTALPRFTGLAVSLPLVLVLLVGIVGATGAANAPSHVAGVLTLSILGFMVAVFYILTNAPDLALTQFVVETLVMVIFLLILDKLPAFYGEATRIRTLTDGTVATVVGITVFVTVLVSTAATPDDPIFRFFVKRAPVPEDPGRIITNFAGGNNVVNVILVDFRAFDTMGEISVVAMAALAVLTLKAMRGRGQEPAPRKDQSASDQGDESSGGEYRD